MTRHDLACVMFCMELGLLHAGLCRPCLVLNQVVCHLQVKCQQKLASANSALQLFGLCS